MMRRAALFIVVPIALLVAVAAARIENASNRPAAEAPAAAAKERVVFLAGGLGEEELLTFTATLAASGHPGVALVDSPSASPYLKTFLAALEPEQVIPVGTFPEGVADLERRLGCKTAPALEWKRGPPAALWKAL